MHGQSYTEHQFSLSIKYEIGKVLQLFNTFPPKSGGSMSEAIVPCDIHSVNTLII